MNIISAYFRFFPEESEFEEVYIHKDLYKSWVRWINNNFPRGEYYVTWRSAIPTGVLMYNLTEEDVLLYKLKFGWQVERWAYDDEG